MPAIPDHTVFSPERRADFLESLADHGNIRLACRVARVSPQTAYRARRRSGALACAWDAALVAARGRAEEELADRALNGVEEKVYYHGEEVATRRRYDARLLLAHLARLDKHAERVDVAASLATFDDQIEALRRGEELVEVLPGDNPSILRPSTGSGPQHERVGNEQLGDQDALLRQAQDDRISLDQDSVPCVPSSNKDGPSSSSEAIGQIDNPCPDCGGRCLDEDAELTQADCQWLGNRLERMYAARPADASTPYQLTVGELDAGEIEWVQLLAFEDGRDEWWTILPEGEGEEDELATEP